MFFAAGLFQRWREKYWPKPAICVCVSLQVGHDLCCWVVPTLAGEVLAETSYMCWCIIAGCTCTLLLVVPTLAGEVLAETSCMCWCVIAGWTCSLLLECSNVGGRSTGRNQLYVPSLVVLTPSVCITSKAPSTSCLYSSSYLVLSSSPKLSTPLYAGCTRGNKKAALLTHITRRNKEAVLWTHISRITKEAVLWTHTSRRNKGVGQLTCTS